MRNAAREAGEGFAEIGQWVGGHLTPAERAMFVLMWPLGLALALVGLFVDREFTKSINDIPKDEGRAMLNFLFDHTERVAFQCRFRWSENAVAIWDNRCLLHHAMWDYWPDERLGRRITVKGEHPVAWRLGKDTLPDKTSGVVKLSR